MTIEYTIPHQVTIIAMILTLILSSGGKVAAERVDLNVAPSELGTNQWLENSEFLNGCH